MDQTRFEMHAENSGFRKELKESSRKSCIWTFQKPDLSGHCHTEILNMIHLLLVPQEY